jgi:hypothetical protein
MCAQRQQLLQRNIEQHLVEFASVLPPPRHESQCQAIALPLSFAPAPERCSDLRDSTKRPPVPVREQSRLRVGAAYPQLPRLETRPGYVPAGPVEAGDQTSSNRIGARRHYDWDGLRDGFCSSDCRRAFSHDDIQPRLNQLGGDPRKRVLFALGKTVLEADAAPRPSRILSIPHGMPQADRALPSCARLRAGESQRGELPKLLPAPVPRPAMRPLRRRAA